MSINNKLKFNIFSTLKIYENVKLYNLKKVKKAWYAGAFKNNDTLINEFIFKKRGEIFSISDSKIIQNHKFKNISNHESIIWGGFIIPHYGHFLLESLTRFYAFNHSEETIVFFAKSLDIPSWVREIFEILNISNRVNIIAIDSIINVKNLKIAKAGYELETTKYYQKFFKSLKIYDKINIKFLNKKVWFSRSKLKKRFIINEDTLEKQLQSHGWTIIHPELLPVKEQVSVFTSANRIAGFIGSAFHSIILTKTISVKLDLFLLSEKTNINYINIAKARNIQQNIHDIGLRSISGNEFNKSTWKISSSRIEKILTILKIKN